MSLSRVSLSVSSRLSSRSRGSVCRHVVVDRIIPRSNCYLQLPRPLCSIVTPNHILHRSFFLNPTIIMDDVKSASAGDTQHTIAAAQPSVAVATDQDMKQDNGQDNNDNGQDVNQSKSTQDGGATNSKQKKAARWKQMNRKKKDNKRQKTEKEGGQDKNKRSKKEYDAGPVAPHEGSFANEGMQKLFNVTIDVSSEGEEKGKESTTDGNDNAADDKVPKRKLALLVSFLGSNYTGFQINHEQRTLHAEIELGLYRAGIISKMNFGHPKKSSWSNSARTDKGVHAAAQVCSFKGEMVFHNELGESQMKQQMDAMREKVNEYLPEDIRVLDFERVTRNYCARTSRDKVRYQYMVPSYMLCSPEEVRKAFPAVVDDAKTASETKMTPKEASDIIEDTVGPEVLTQARNALVDYRVTPEQMERFKSGLKLFEGTHSFHNYTRRVGAEKAEAMRYILKFYPVDPIVVPGGVNDDGSKQPDTQWIPLQVVGQSFLLNQIRKMVSAAVDLARGTVSEEQIGESFSKKCRMKVNVAPAQGLFLDRSYYNLYNEHKIKKAPKYGDSRDRDTLDWVEVEGEEMPAAGEISLFSHANWFAAVTNTYLTPVWSHLSCLLFSQQFVG